MKSVFNLPHLITGYEATANFFDLEYPYWPSLTKKTKPTNCVLVEDATQLPTVEAVALLLRRG